MPIWASVHCYYNHLQPCRSLIRALNLNELVIPIKTHIRELQAKIEQWNREYYLDDNPTVPDAEFDRVLKELKALESEYPELIDPNSPTQRVGGAVGNSFKPVPHIKPMLSLDNVFNETDLAAWYAAINGTASIQFCSEPKFDGLAISLY